jgi:CubicO group peptidase (beta-lactamase class C family)
MYYGQMNSPTNGILRRTRRSEVRMLRLLFLRLACLLAANLLVARSGDLADEPMTQKLDALFQPLVDAQSPGLAVLVRKDGQTRFECGYGLRELRTHSNVDPYTNFRLASFTKQFTATAIMLIVHDGNLRYEETLAEIIPDFPAYGKNITVRNLLNHTSGLPDYEDLMDAVEKIKGPRWSPQHQIQDDEVLALLKKETKGKFAPGTSWSYSNSGYVVLGVIVAKTSGKSYRDFLRERIFAPLKMNHTVVYQKGKNEITNRAFGHTKQGDSFEQTDQSSTSATLGDGGIYSNLKDLAKWDDALRNHTLLTAEEMKPALTPAKLADGSQPRWPTEPNDDNLHPGKPVSYGFGWFLDPYESHGVHPRMWHTGSTMGFRTVIERFIENNLTVIILSNRTDLDPEKLALEVASYYPSLK